MPLITRTEKGSKLTIQDMDGNLEYLETLGETMGYTKYVISIPSSSILDFQNTRPEIIPNALTTSSLYVIHPTLSYVEYEFNTTPYTVIGGGGANQIGSFGASISYYDEPAESLYTVVTFDENILGFQSNGFSGFTNSELNPRGFSMQLSGSLPLVVQLPSVDLENPGDGSLRVVVYAKQIIFGL
jgi:hypothetical protein